MFSFPCGTPVAGLIVVHPGIEFKSIEADPLCAYGQLREKRPHFDIEAVAVHAEVAGCVAKSNDARRDLRRCWRAARVAHAGGSVGKIVTTGARPSLRSTVTRPARSSQASALYLALRSSPKR